MYLVGIGRRKSYKIYVLNSPCAVFYSIQLVCEFEVVGKLLQQINTETSATTTDRTDIMKISLVQCLTIVDVIPVVRVYGLTWHRATHFTLASLIVGRHIIDKWRFFQPTHTHAELQTQ